MDPLLLLAVFAAALLYSTTGHGGASAYLAIFALAGVSPAAAVPAALVMNVVVAGTGFHNYRRAGHLDLKLLAPFVLFSIPAAFLGATVPLDPRTYGALVGAALLAAALRYLLIGREQRWKLRLGPRSFAAASALLGTGLGLLAGMTGIGGGVYLTPLLLLLGWATIKGAAAVSAGFILLNSVSGLASRALQGVPPDALLMAALLAPAVFAGGWLGSRSGAGKLSRPAVQRSLGAVLALAGAKVLVG